MKRTSASWFWTNRAFKLNKECQLFEFGRTGLLNAGFFVLDKTAFQRTRLFGFGRIRLFVEERRILGFGRNGFELLDFCKG
ncbi:unnamed protein product [Rhizophagus irregularis]|nr:unnamed protein product [Rhizophagus irregularis]